MSVSSNLADSSVAEEFGARWNRFWFTPADPLSAAVLRIIVGVLAAAHFLDLGRGLSLWYASDGVLPPAAVRRLLELTGGDPQHHLSYLNLFPASPALTVVHLLAIVAAIAFAAGFLTRISGVVTLIATLAYVHRVPQVAGHVEPVLSFLLLYLVVAPSGACLSIDRLLFGAGKKGALGSLLVGSCEPSITANIGLRLIQIHL